MTAGLRLFVLADAEHPATDGQGRPLNAAARGLDRLGAALAARGHHVTVRDGPLAEAPTDHWILLFSADPAEALVSCGERAPALRRSLALMDEDRVSAVELMHEVGPSFVVTSRSFRNWLLHPGVAAEVVSSRELALASGVAQQDLAAERYPRFLMGGISLPEGVAQCCATVDAIEARSGSR